MVPKRVLSATIMSNFFFEKKFNFTLVNLKLFICEFYLNL